MLKPFYQYTQQTCVTQKVSFIFFALAISQRKIKDLRIKLNEEYYSIRSLKASSISGLLKDSPLFNKPSFFKGHLLMIYPQFKSAIDNKKNVDTFKTIKVEKMLAIVENLGLQKTLLLIGATCDHKYYHSTILSTKIKKPTDSFGYLISKSFFLKNHAFSSLQLFLHLVVNNIKNVENKADDAKS